MPDRTPTHQLRLAVTGTDTGVGKTLVSCALVTNLRAGGLRVAAMKPVETGITDGTPDSDAARLRRAAGAVHAHDDVCPIVYAEPLAPLVAGDRAHRAVDLGRLDAARARLEALADALVVEGAGGLLVPFARDSRGQVVDFAALALAWHLAVVVVAANRLGVVNHTLLTIREAERRGLTVRAVVLNDRHPDHADVAERTNLGVLRELLPAVPVVAFAHVPPETLGDDRTLARAAAPLAAVLRADTGAAADPPPADDRPAHDRPAHDRPAAAAHLRAVAAPLAARRAPLTRRSPAASHTHPCPRPRPPPRRSHSSRR